MRVASPHSPVTLGQVFVSSAERLSGRPALWIAGHTWTYGQLLEVAAGIARQLVGSGIAATGRPCAIYAHRSLSAYAGILAAQLCDLPFVPLNPRFPAARSKAMIEVAEPAALIADVRHVSRVGELLAGTINDLRLIIVPEVDRRKLPTDLHHPSRISLGKDDVLPETWSPNLSRGTQPDSAYIMFTSGTTGRPKGVRVLQRNVLSYLSSIGELIQLEQDDRATQLFDLTFDLSVHDLFATWAAGACLYVFQDADLLAPLDMVERHQLTCWFSVPTVAAMARPKLSASSRLLKSLRLTLFCGEALPSDLAHDWQLAAPSSAVFNLYGPTEATIAVTAFRVGSGNATFGLPTVPIGVPLAGHTVRVVNEAGEPVTPGEAGELLVAGPQIAAGYVNDDPANQAGFIEAALEDGVLQRWYRTGDLVKAVENVGLVFLGRRDLQVKISGYRVELLEVEAALRQASGCDLVAAVPWPLLEAGTARNLVGILRRCGTDPAVIIRRCASLLPVYMVPRKIVIVEDMPLNANGKVDREALSALCQSAFLRDGRNH